MDITKSRREERLMRISKIRATLLKAFKDDLIVDFDQIIAQACLEWGCTRRYVAELIDLLRISMAFKIETNAGVKQIIPPEKKLTAPDKLNDEKKQGPG